jgi:hypothetical protein
MLQSDEPTNALNFKKSRWFLNVPSIVIMKATKMLFQKQVNKAQPCSVFASLSHRIGLEFFKWKMFLPLKVSHLDLTLEWEMLLPLRVHNLDLISKGKP